MVSLSNEPNTPPAARPAKPLPQIQHIVEDGIRYIYISTSSSVDSNPSSPPTPPGHDPVDSQVVPDFYDGDYFRFALELAFTLRFSVINYPLWARDPAAPLPYQPVPLAPMPGMPLIPDEEDYEFAHVTNETWLNLLVNDACRVHGYKHLGHADVVCVYLTFTDRDGLRVRVKAKLSNADLVTKAWAKDVFTERLDQLPKYCRCDQCVAGGRELGHGLEIEIVFPQGVKRYGEETTQAVQTFGGKRKLPFQPRKDAADGRVVKKVRF